MFSSLVVFVLAVLIPPSFEARPLLDAIRRVESGGENSPNAAVGDNGKSLGAYQISVAYWRDAVEYDPSLISNGETYEDVKNPQYAERVILAYWHRYAKTWSYQELARLHNGGPTGPSKKSTLRYWKRIREVLP